MTTSKCLKSNINKIVSCYIKVLLTLSTFTVAPEKTGLKGSCSDTMLI